MLTNALIYTCFTLDFHYHTFADCASWCMFCHARNFFEKRLIHYATSTNALHVLTLMIISIGLTIPNPHLSRNVFQCNPRRKRMCTNWQRRYKLLHSYTGCYCIRWYLQWQFHILIYVNKIKLINVMQNLLFHYTIVGSVAPELIQPDSFETIYGRNLSWHFLAGSTLGTR